MLEPGSPAPDFELPDASGSTVRLSDFRGRPVVVYFYPKDMTPGCTQEACDFRDRFAELQAAGAALVGISPDDPRSHAKFAAKYALPFPLLSDVGAKTASEYGVWKEKSLYGRTFMGVERSTFLIDAEGRIARVWRKVRVAGHGDEVLQAVRSLGSG